MSDSHKLALGGTADLRSDLRYHEIEHPQPHIYTMFLPRTNSFQCSCHYLQSIPWVHALICLGKIRCDPLSSCSVDTHCRFIFLLVPFFTLFSTYASTFVTKSHPCGSMHQLCLFTYDPHFPGFTWTSIASS